MGANPAFAALRETLERRHREASAAAFALGDEALVRTQIPAVDRILGGGELSVSASLRQPMIVPDTISALDALERLKAEAAQITAELGQHERQLAEARSSLRAALGLPPIYPPLYIESH